MSDTQLAKKLVFGVATNDANYITRRQIDGKIVVCPIYRKWINMLTRCYCQKYQKRQPTYRGTTVCDEWLLFSNFARWMTSQDWQGKELDKDLMCPGNKVYSPNTCLFVSKRVNTLLGDSRSAIAACGKRGKRLLTFLANIKNQLFQG